MTLVLSMYVYFLGLQMSDSDEEDEYTEGKKVFDSDSEAEEEEEVNENALPTDKKRVLEFFNDATEPELVAIQGIKNYLFYTLPREKSMVP